MAVDPNACIFCELVHKGPCGGPAPKAKKTPAPRGRAPIKSPSEDRRGSNGPAEQVKPTWEAAPVDEEQAALNALAGIMHDSELSKRGMRRPSQPQIAARAAAWKAGRHGSS